MLLHRKNKPYKQYKYIQGYKFRNRIDAIKAKNKKRIEEFIAFFKEAKPYLQEGNILCLGARTGCEVEAARQVGFNNSIGVDLYPAGKNVIYGDWHNLPFKNNSFSNVFTNSLDHCYDIDKLSNEIQRVLILNGGLFIQVQKKDALKNKKDKNKHIEEEYLDYLFWDEINDLQTYFYKKGFELFYTWNDDKRESFVLRGCKHNGNK
ncbi:MAG: methyltransferase domain-containing protein [Candidatus Cloacimonetes bacterium]|nr:methyltransferase domain-containing protein [Candidatus Cloacimonadota bacterium]